MADFAALWDIAELPQLPPHAPPIFRAYTVDVTDPRRVYTIYEGSRRHHLALLIEKLIQQIRYGCEDQKCIAPACFSCRRRLAGDRPVRRFNATSARGLAVHLAGEDNPERHLCQNINRKSRSHALTPNTYPHKSAQKQNSRTPKRSISSSNAEGQVESNRHNIVSQPSPKDNASYISGSAHDQENPTKGDETSERSYTSLERFNEQVKLDSKSFVQNLFNTTPFRLLEWLTPRNLARTISDATQEGSKLQLLPTKAECGFDAGPQDIRQLPKHAREYESNNGNIVTAASKLEDYSGSKANEPSFGCSEGQLPGEIASEDLKPVKQAIEPRTKTAEFPLNQEDHGTFNTSLQHSQRLNGSLIREVQKDFQEHIPKTRINGTTPNPYRLNSSHATNCEPNIFPELDKTSSSFLSRNLSSSPIQSLNHDCRERSRSGSTSALSTANSQHVQPSFTSRSEPTSQFTSSDTAQTTASTCRQIPMPAATHLQKRAQSLILFDKDVMGIISEIMPYVLREDYRSKFTSLVEVDNAQAEDDLQHEQISGEKFYFGPYNQPSSTFKSSLKNLRTTHMDQLQTSILGGDIRNIPHQVHVLWKSFIEQSLFYVFSSPHLLTQSFSDNRSMSVASIYDSQLTYHYMKMLLCYSREAVLKSLWIAAGHLYFPPPELKEVYTSLSINGTTGQETGFCTNRQASTIIQLCLHTLIAAMPSTDSWEATFNVSKHRAHGDTVPQSWRDKDDVRLSLAYNDILTDGLALRLAQRVFAAIPARVHFQELARKTNIDDTVADVELDVASVVADLALTRLSQGRGEADCDANFTRPSRELYHKVSPGLIFDWALTTILSEWNGSPIVPAGGTLGGALAVIDAIYVKRAELSVVDGYFVVQAFQDRMNDPKMPISWLTFQRSSKQLHLLDYPYFFFLGTRMQYFRNINFHIMSRAHESAESMGNKIAHMASPMALMTDPSRRERLEKRLAVALDPYLVLKIRRSHVLEDAFDQLWRREARELARPLKVRLGEGEGEEGVDSGGVQQEFMRLAIAEAMDPNYGLFTVDDRTRMIWFQPGSPEPLWKFEMIGVIISLAIYNGLTLPVTFPKAMYSRLTGIEPTNINHIVDGWPDLARSLDALLEWDENELGSIEEVLCRTYEFSVPLFTEVVTREMIRGKDWPQYAEVFLRKEDNSKPQTNPDVRLVDASNRHDFVTDYIHWLVNVSVAPQFEAFKKGFMMCLHPKSVALLGTAGLRNIVEGWNVIDIPSLQYYAKYEGYTPHDQYMTDFWDIVKAYSEDDKKRFLEFVTASDRVPAAGYEHVQFVISKNGEAERDGHLPTAYTCYGTLLLPMYSSKEVLRQKLGIAIQNAQGFGFT